MENERKTTTKTPTTSSPSTSAPLGNFRRIALGARKASPSNNDNNNKSSENSPSATAASATEEVSPQSKTTKTTANSLIKVDTSGLVQFVDGISDNVKHQQNIVSELQDDMKIMRRRVEAVKTEAVKEVQQVSSTLTAKITEFRKILGEDEDENLLQQQDDDEQQQQQQYQQQQQKRSSPASIPLTGKKITPPPHLSRHNGKVSPGTSRTSSAGMMKKAPIITNNNNSTTSPTTATTSTLQRTESATLNSIDSFLSHSPSMIVVDSSSSSPLPYSHLPRALRHSFEFIRNESKVHFSEMEDRISSKIESAIAHAVKQISEEFKTKQDQSMEEMKSVFESKIQNLSRSLQGRVSEVQQEMSREFHASREAETTLKTAVSSVTSFAQRVEQRFNERFDGADHRTASLEKVLRDHMKHFADVTNRIMPLVGGSAMDQAVSASRPFQQSYYQQANVIMDSELASLSHHDNDTANAGVTGDNTATTTTTSNENNANQSNENTNTGDNNNNNNNNNTENASPMLIQQQQEGASYFNHFQNIGAATSNANNDNENYNNNSSVPSSLVGSIDVEVLASHDARAIAMLHTPPFIALRHQQMQDTKMRIASARDSILGELENHLQELRHEIQRRPLPSRVAEMIREMTNDRQIPEQFSAIKSQLRDLEHAKISHHFFNDALKTKADVTLAMTKADSEDVSRLLAGVNHNLDEVKQGLANVQTERLQFRQMLREVLYMHRRAQALSVGGGGEEVDGGDFSAATEFSGGGDLLSLSSPSGGGHENKSNNSSSSNRQQSAYDTNANIGIGGTGTASHVISALQVRDPVLPLVQQANAYEVVDDPRNRKNFQQNIINSSPNNTTTSSNSLKRQKSGHHQQHSSSQRGLTREGSLRRSLPSSHNQPPPTAPSNLNQQQQQQPPSSSSGSRSGRAQQLIDSVLTPNQTSSAPSPPRTAQSGSRSFRNSNTSAGGSGLQDIGSRDMTQRQQRKVFTPNSSPAMDL